MPGLEIAITRPGSCPTPDYEHSRLCLSLVDYADLAFAFTLLVQEMELCWPRFRSFKSRAGKNGYPKSHLLGGRQSTITTKFVQFVQFVQYISSHSLDNFICSLAYATNIGCCGRITSYLSSHSLDKLAKSLDKFFGVGTGNRVSVSPKTFLMKRSLFLATGDWGLVIGRSPRNLKKNLRSQKKYFLGVKFK
jgi:hypothetical protein